MLTQVVNLISLHGMVNCARVVHKALIGTFFFQYGYSTPNCPVSSVTYYRMSHDEIPGVLPKAFNEYMEHTSMPTTFCKRRQRQKGVGDPSAVEGIRHPLPVASACILCHHFTSQSLHTDSLLGENESEQAHTILSTGSEQPKIKYLYLIWSSRIELQLLNVCAANGQRNRVSNLCAGFPSFAAWMDTTQQWGTAAAIPSG